MTVAMLMQNTVGCAELLTSTTAAWSLKYLTLKRVNPVPRYVAVVDSPLNFSISPRVFFLFLFNNTSTICLLIIHFLFGFMVVW